MNIFLTGGSNGIGKCLRQSLETQHNVYAPTRSELDLSVYPDCDLSSFDVLLLCAGSDLGGKKPFVDMEDQHWQNTLQVNLLSNMQLIKDFVKTKSNKYGKIIVIGSTATDYIWPGMLPYSISKLALEQFCRSLRREISKNIGITIVRPGLVKTNFNYARNLGRLSQEQADQWYHSQSYLLPEDLVDPVNQAINDTQHTLQEITVTL